MSSIPDSLILNQIYAPVDLSQMFQNERQCINTTLDDWRTIFGLNLQHVDVYFTGENPVSYELLRRLSPTRGSNRVILIDLIAPPNTVKPVEEFPVKEYMKLSCPDPLFFPAGRVLGHTRTGTYDLSSGDIKMPLGGLTFYLQGLIKNYYSQMGAGIFTRFDVTAWCKRFLGPRPVRSNEAPNREASNPDLRLNTKGTVARRSTPQPTPSPAPRASTPSVPSSSGSFGFQFQAPQTPQPSPGNFMQVDSIPTPGVGPVMTGYTLVTTLSPASDPSPWTQPMPIPAPQTPATRSGNQKNKENDPHSPC